MKPSRRSVRGAVLLLVLLGICTWGCVYNPVTGEREFSLMSAAEERRIGASMDQEIVAEYGVVDDPEIRDYVSGVGARLVASSHDPEATFTFRVLDDPLVNAFALPGGYVYLTRGILAHLQDEAAMAGVLGHEIGHVTARHSAQRYTQQVIWGAGLELGSLAVDASPDLEAALGSAAQLLLLKYSRDDEREADDLGVQYAGKLGYDTTSMAAFFTTLERLSGARPGPLSWFSTHPDPGERAETIRRRSRELAGAPQELRRGREDFLNSIDGLVYGEDPRQGFVRGGRFHHPALRFRFDVPAGWRLRNAASRVELGPPEGDMAVVLSVSSRYADPRDAARAFRTYEGVQPEQSMELTVNGHPAVELVSSLESRERPLAALSTFIQKDNHVFSFHGLARPEAFGARRGRLASVARSFAELKDPELLAVSPVVIRVVQAPRTGTFSEVVRDWPVPEGSGADVAELALMNGMHTGTPVESGRLLKVLAGGR